MGFLKNESFDNPFNAESNPTVPTVDVDVFHLRILALRLARMIWAYSSVFSDASGMAECAIDVRCDSRSPWPCRCWEMDIDDLWKEKGAVEKLAELEGEVDREAAVLKGEIPCESGETPRS